MKNDRLFQILYLLLERGTMTAPELSRALEVSVRTVYRDMETLSASGIPIEGERGVGYILRAVRGRSQSAPSAEHEVRFGVVSGKGSSNVLRARGGVAGGIAGGVAA